MKIKRALISVSDKTGLEELVRILDGLGVEIMSTGGTAKAISDMGVKVTEVASYTKFPEMMDGRVKTLHPKIHAGLLAVRDNAEHMKQLEENGILPIDMVVVNLYPFEETVAREGVTLAEAVENIDIGGPTMLRSASKNYRFVAVVSSSDQYAGVIEELKTSGGELSDETLAELAATVFKRTSEYDRAITEYLRGQGSRGHEGLPDRISIELEKSKDLRYGENPHQRGAFYRCTKHKGKGVSAIEQLQGKELSFNNIMDLGAAVDIVKDMAGPAASIIKHNNPCGVAMADTLQKAYIDALASDTLSAFGSIMGFNRSIDKEMAETILNEADFVECIIAPGYGEEAMDVFSSKKNLRVLEIPSLDVFSSSKRDLRKVPGGFLVQDADTGTLQEKQARVVTKIAPPKELMESLFFAWNIVKHVKSNAIVLARGTRTVGIGAGQMSRVDSVIIAVRKAGDRAKDAVLASDAFFPMADSIEEAHKAGISAIIQPGGSMRDQEVIDACNRLGIPMVFTGVRHFKH
ncbi:MAG: bifunctional phosphoribosylaminoimidazolecarboxamide formyltransferase/IMP cyclohydrolase [Candidatus Omnitrophica bacterium]|nr:bifunctional phosphoribosylaminoimidazolecarboxamide formyltransferase/IMP cyclohydrolase [Candidatus Omnitrophota bacterium]